MKKGFTLAEVLITLTIIGVIAALTIPNLMRKWEDQHTVSAVKEAYSILSNALKMAVRENGTISSWQDKGIILSQYLKVQKYCGKNVGCMPVNYGKYELFNNLDNYGLWQCMDTTNCGGAGSPAYSGKMILQNGMNVTIIRSNTSETVIRVDINGGKKPNKLGYDAFFFAFDDNGNPTNYYYTSSKPYCGLYVHGDGTEGASCAYWIMKHGNVDYKYRDVSAEW